MNDYEKGTTMRDFKICRPLSAIAKVIAIAALAAVGSHAAAQIANTKHNLGTGGATGNNRVTAGTDEICVFCHTPHGSNTGMTSAPLWNKATPASTTYQVYDTTVSSTIDGAVLQPGAGGGSVSIACLSCHDGTQAMDNIINAPGSGGHDPTGGGANGLGYTWEGTRVNAQGLLQNAGGFIAMLDTDLRNDHPIGIQYCGGGVNTTSIDTANCLDADFSALQTNVINLQRVWWVDSGTNTGNRDKGDMILYSRDFETVRTGAGVGPSVECASCHDPHTANTTFLRIQNTGSAVCLACHNK